MSPNTQNIDDILDQFLLENPEPSHEQMTKLIQEYPQFRADILEFAVAWALNDASSVDEPFTAVEMDRIIDRNDSDVASFFYRRDEKAKAASAANDPATASHLQGRTLKQLSEAAGMALPDLATLLCLDVSVIAKLNTCLVRPDTIPEKLFELASNCLHESREIVRVSVCGPPRFSVGAANLSKDKPSLPDQISFQDAVNASHMDDPHKKKWLVETA
jgi:hypothetical protein